jgi:hypothetical protein
VHNFTYAIYGHSGDWAEGMVVAAAERLNQPYVTFQTTVHNGGLGKAKSFVSADPSQVVVMAVKKAESGVGYIVRVREVAGKSWSNVSLDFSGEIVSAQEVNGMEEPKGSVGSTTKAISFFIGPYQPKTFAVQLHNPFGTTSVHDEKIIPTKFSLLPAYPNPSNGSITISYDLPQDAPVKIKIYNQLGQLVRTLQSDRYSKAGRNSCKWDQSNSKGEWVSSGVYFIRLETIKNNATQKIIILK